MMKNNPQRRFAPYGSVGMKRRENNRKTKQVSERSAGNRGSSPFLQELIDAIPLPIFYKDVRGIYLGGNRAFGGFLGRRIEEIVGKTVDDIAPKDLAERYRRADEELLRSGGTQVYEASVMHADGTKHDVVFSKAVFLDQEGRIGGLVGSIFDITEQKKAEENLRTSEARYRRIFESIQDVYYEVEFDGTIRELSPSIEKKIPCKREDFIGRSIYEFYADQEKRNELLVEIREKGRVDDFEIRLLDRQGSLFTCAITAEILPAEGDRPPRLVGSLRDITKRKRAEDELKMREEELAIQSANLLELNAALKVLLRQREEDRTELEERVLSNVRTAILPYLEKLKAGPMTKRQRDCLAALESHIREIVSPFLHRVSQSYFDLTPQEIAVADLVKSGKTTKEIGAVLGISVRTVDSHRNSIRKKVGIRNRGTGLRSFLMKLS